MEILEFRAKVQELETKGLQKSKLFYELCKECNLTAEELKDHLKQLPNFGDYSVDFYAFLSRSRKKQNPQWGAKGDVPCKEKKPKDYAPNDYMKQIGIIREHLEELNARIATLEQEKRNLMATIRQILDDFDKK